MLAAALPVTPPLPSRRAAHTFIFVCLCAGPPPLGFGVHLPTSVVVQNQPSTARLLGGCTRPPPGHQIRDVGLSFAVVAPKCPCSPLALHFKLPFSYDTLSKLLNLLFIDICSHRSA